MAYISRHTATDLYSVSYSSSALCTVQKQKCFVILLTLHGVIRTSMISHTIADVLFKAIQRALVL
jgi:hypothetical protein